MHTALVRAMLLSEVYRATWVLIAHALSRDRARTCYIRHTDSSSLQCIHSCGNFGSVTCITIMGLYMIYMICMLSYSFSLQTEGKDRFSIKSIQANVVTKLKTLYSYPHSSIDNSQVHKY